MSNGILFRYSSKKENIWVHISCIQWFNYKIEKDENNYFYLTSNIKNFMDYLTSECHICKKTKKGDFLINCKNPNKNTYCDNIFYHKDCLIKDPLYNKYIIRKINDDKHIYKIFICPDHCKIFAYNIILFKKQRIFLYY